jgi:protocatechuate 3,4-dioxygenase, beta subunit
MNIVRRKFNQLVVVIPVLMSPLFAKAQRAISSTTKRLATPQDTEGPFYPKQWVGEIDHDLLSFNGKQYANGIPLALAGRVYSVDGEPVTGATVEIWQCDEIGEYRHPSGSGEAPARRGFQGFGKAISSSDGSYLFRTLKPVPYQGRPAHVHFRVVAAGHRELTTQMYFSGESQESNSLSRRFGFAGGFSKERDKLTVMPETRRIDGKTELYITFDITLGKIT